MKRKLLVGFVICALVLSGVTIPEGKSESWSEWNVKFRGTAVDIYPTDCSTSYPPVCWDVQVEEILINSSEKPIHIGEVVTVDPCDASGYIDPSISVGDRVEVYGGWSVFLDHIYLFGDSGYIKKIGGGTLQVNLWIDKGCGATYKDGESIAVYFEVTKDAYVVIYDYLTTGGVQTINIGYVSAGQHGFTATVAGPSGKETLEIVARDSYGNTATDTCSFYVKENTGSIKVIVKDQNGNRIENAKIYLDVEMYKGKTNSSGELIISNLSPGNYSVRASKSGYKDDSDSVYVEAGETKTVYLTLSKECSEGYTGNTRCSGCWIQREYQYSDCTKEWKNYEDCNKKDGFVGEKYCKNGDVYQKYRDYYCENGECKYREEERKIKDCDYGCENGGCIVDPCAHDSDNDGVPDCEDICADTPPEYYVDEKGCKVCLNKKAVCALQAKGLIPVYGVIPSSKIVINDLCLLADAINSGEDAITIILLADTLYRDAMGFIVDALMAVHDVLTGKLDIPVTALYTAIKSARLILDCGLDFADSYGADESFYEDIHDGFSESLAEKNMNAMNIYVGSPVELVIRDEKGNILSKDNDMGIPEGFFFEHNHYKFAFVINPEGEYKIETVGTDEGSYDLKINTITDGKITKSKEFDDVQTSQGKVDIYNVNIASSGKVDIGKSGKSSFKYLSVIAIILLISIIGFYVYRGKKGGRPPSFGERSRLAKKLNEQYETEKVTKEEHFQKMKEEKKRIRSPELQRLLKERNKLKNLLIKLKSQKEKLIFEGMPEGEYKKMYNQTIKKLETIEKLIAMIEKK